jgi:hypothetical protein
MPERMIVTIGTRKGLFVAEAPKSGTGWPTIMIRLTGPPLRPHSMRGGE